MRLSHSAMEKYRSCPASYNLHYNEKLRSHRIPSPFLLGTATDEAFNIILLRKKDSLTESEKNKVELDPYKIFDYYFTKRQVGEELLDIRTSELPEYYKSDFDPFVLKEEDWKTLEMYIKNAGYDIEDPEELYYTLQDTDKKGLSFTDACYINYCCWLSLRRKGHLMIDTYVNEIMPKIKKVHSIQREVDLPNDDGDHICGFIDFEAELEGHEGIYTVDNKTSGRSYKKDAVNEKEQLLLYDEETNNGKAAYIVLLKDIKHTKELTCVECGKVYKRAVKSCGNTIDGKKCNGELELSIVESKAKHQIVVDTINEEKKDLLFEEIDDILLNIREEKFPQNRDNCFSYGKKCIYYDVCRDGNREGLHVKRR